MEVLVARLELLGWATFGRSFLESGKYSKIVSLKLCGVWSQVVSPYGFPWVGGVEREERGGKLLAEWRLAAYLSQACSLSRGRTAAVDRDERCFNVCDADTESPWKIETRGFWSIY